MGMFGDGLLYSSLARNLAEGRGQIWAPFFSTGYWIDFASGNPYFENPPLMIWLQAGFFRLLGDPWWVEKLYTLLLFILNAWLIARVWEISLRGSVFQGKYGWLPLFFWYFIPSAIWGNPNNLMDNNLLTFCLLALYFVLNGAFSQEKTWLNLTLAGVFIYLGFMTKGPVALYPLAAPFLFAVIFEKANWKRGFFQSAWVGFVAGGLFLLMLALIPDARVYFENYWEKRLGVVIAGTREDAALSGWARLKIFVILTKELAGLAALMLILFFTLQRKKSQTPDPDSSLLARKTSLLFLLLGFCGTLPLIASARQSGMYIIPSLPIFALAAGYFCLPSLHDRLANPSEKTIRFLNHLRIFSFAGAAVLAVYLIFIFGKPARERALQAAIPVIQKAIPKGEKVAVCEQLMSDLHAHAYLQRFHHLELTRDFSSARYALTEQRCDAKTQEILRQNGFQKWETETPPSVTYFIYSKK
ncbi:MAG: hypothetical protein OHK0019_03920 [Saprospiraceae bacterium]